MNYEGGNSINKYCNECLGLHLKYYNKFEVQSAKKKCHHYNHRFVLILRATKKNLREKRNL